MTRPNSTIVWQNPASLPKLTTDGVHIWRANLDLPRAEIEKLSNLLREDELARANKFRFLEHKNNFIAARGILRRLLGHYLNIEPQNIKFDYGDRGKPRLRQTKSPTSLEFNISHSQKYALFGFACDRIVGVDLEYLREMKDAVKIARRFFSDREFESIANLDVSQQARVFFQLWTAKEAYLKAIGVGLAGSLANIEIILERSGNAKIWAIDSDRSKAQDWSMLSCIPERDYTAAIAIYTPLIEPQIDFWSWSPNF